MWSCYEAPNVNTKQTSHKPRKWARRWNVWREFSTILFLCSMDVCHVILGPPSDPDISKNLKAIEIVFMTLRGIGSTFEFFLTGLTKSMCPNIKDKHTEHVCCGSTFVPRINRTAALCIVNSTIKGRQIRNNNSNNNPTNIQTNIRWSCTY